VRINNLELTFNIAIKEVCCYHVLVVVTH